MGTVVLKSVEGGWVILREITMAFASFGLAVLGGLVRCLRGPKDGFSWWILARRVTAAGFVGALVHLTCSYFEVRETLQCAISGACGYAAIDLLDAVGPMLLKFVHRRLGLKEDSAREGNTKIVVLICVTSLLIGGLAIWQLSPAVTESIQAMQQRLNDAAWKVEQIDRTVNERVVTIYVEGKKRVQALSADAVASELNAELELWRLGLSASGDSNQ